MPGRLAELHVDLGSRVRRGQTVARLDPTDFQLRLEQAQASLAQARARLGLSPQGTDDRMDPAETAIVRQARAVLEEARLTRERMARLWDQQLIVRAQLDAAVAAERVAEVFASMFILSLVVVGAAAYFRLGVDRFPSVDLPTVTVRTELPGASIVVVTFNLNRPIDVATQDVRDRVAAALRNLPRDIRPPIISKFDNDQAPVLTVAVSGPRSLKELTAGGHLRAGLLHVLGLRPLPLPVRAHRGGLGPGQPAGGLHPHPDDVGPAAAGRGRRGRRRSPLGLWVARGGGGLVRLDNLVRIVPALTPARIDRSDRQREVRLRASVAPGYGQADRIQALRAEVARMNLPAGYTTAVSGRARELERTFREFLWVFLR